VFPNYSAAKQRDEVSNSAPVKKEVVGFDDKEFQEFARAVIQNTASTQNEVNTLPLFVNRQKVIEHFNNTSVGNVVQPDMCSSVMKHVLECPGCKESLFKQLNIDVDKKRNEEFMEVISYMIFGLLILLLLDRL
jgi:hypothetical protein